MSRLGWNSNSRLILTRRTPYHYATKEDKRIITRQMKLTLLELRSHPCRRLRELRNECAALWAPGLVLSPWHHAPTLRSGVRTPAGQHAILLLRIVVTWNLRMEINPNGGIQPKRKRPLFIRLPKFCLPKEAKFSNMDSIQSSIRHISVIISYSAKLQKRKKGRKDTWGPIQN